VHLPQPADPLDPIGLKFADIDKTQEQPASRRSSVTQVYNRVLFCGATASSNALYLGGDACIQCSPLPGVSQGAGFRTQRSVTSHLVCSM
jgi:hypothetical protein